MALQKIFRSLPFRSLRVFQPKKSITPLTADSILLPVTASGCSLITRHTSSGKYVDKGELLEIEYNGSKVTLSYIWLRDHCRSERYYNHSTNQRQHDRFDFPLEIRPRDISLEQKSLTLKWEDDHVSKYDVEWLFRNSYPLGLKDKVEKVLWNGEKMKHLPLPMVKCDEYMNTDDGLRKHLENLIKYGFSIVSEVDANIGATQKVVERVCFVKETMFGRMWSFTSDSSRTDTAYSQMGLSAHTDNTYLKDASGIQLFHCVEHIGTGGENLLVDGFQVAEKFKTTHPVEFAYLSSKVIPQEYIEENPPHHTVCVDKVISVDPVTNAFNQIRFNSYDRAPMNTIPPEEHRMFYESYSKFGIEIYNPANEFLYKLTPGNVLFFDNFRVLHGRTAFTGKRVVCGCYLPRDDWIGKARVMKVI